MSGPYENIRRLLTRVFLAPRILKADCIFSPVEFNHRTLYFQPDIATSQPGITIASRVCHLPVFVIGIQKAAAVEYEPSVQARLLQVEKAVYKPRLLSSRAKFEVKSGHWETRTRFASVPLKWMVESRRRQIERFRLKSVDIYPPMMMSLGKIRKFNIGFRSIFRIGIGLACRIPMYKKHIHLLDLDKMDLLRYWKVLLRKAPGGESRDVELLAVFRGIEMEQFRGFEFEEIGGRLRLRPKFPSQRKPVEGRHYDIIIGRYKPLGTILTAVIGSD